jgi:hypothetical protein
MHQLTAMRRNVKTRDDQGLGARPWALFVLARPDYFFKAAAVCFGDA